MMVKGAPEVIIEKCSTIAREGEEIELNDKRIEEFQVRNSSLPKQKIKGSLR